MIGSIILGALHAWRDHKHDQQHHTQENNNMNFKTVKADTLNIGDRFKADPLLNTPWRTVTHKSKQFIIGELVEPSPVYDLERAYYDDRAVVIEGVVGHQPPTDPCETPAGGPTVGSTWRHKHSTTTTEVVFVGKQRALFRYDDGYEDAFLLSSWSNIFEPVRPTITLPIDTWWAYVLSASGFRYGSSAHFTKGDAINWLKGRAAPDGGIVHLAEGGTVEFFDRNGDPADVAKP